MYKILLKICDFLHSNITLLDFYGFLANPYIIADDTLHSLYFKDNVMLSVVLRT